MPTLDIQSSSIEFELIQPQDVTRPVIVFLHEGLGSLAMWKAFPRRVAELTGCPALVYSRCGYGGSSALKELRSIDFMHREALDILPELLDRLRIDKPILLGHSDGASIAIIYAGGSGRQLTGLITMAPHLFVEAKCIASIREATLAYKTADLRAKLARYHNDPDSTFWYWSDIWLSPEFLGWNIEEYVSRIDCPLLAIQGYEDQYGTMDQLHRIERLAHRAELLKLSQCGHSPHHDQPDSVISAIKDFVDTHTTISMGPRVPEGHT